MKLKGFPEKIDRNIIHFDDQLPAYSFGLNDGRNSTIDLFTKILLARSELEKIKECIHNVKIDNCDWTDEMIAQAIQKLFRGG